MENPYRKFDIDEKTGNYPHPNTARTQEEFREIMEIRGYQIDPHCPFFHSQKSNSQSSRDEFVIRADSNGNVVQVNLSAEYRQACNEFFDKMRNEGYIKPPTEQKSLSWKDYAEKLTAELKTTHSQKDALEKSFLHHLKEKGMLASPRD